MHHASMYAYIYKAFNPSWFFDYLSLGEIFYYFVPYFIVRGISGGANVTI
jgi:hypothetical protein